MEHRSSGGEGLQESTITSTKICRHTRGKFHPSTATKFLQVEGVPRPHIPSVLDISCRDYKDVRGQGEYVERGFRGHANGVVINWAFSACDISCVELTERLGATTRMSRETQPSALSRSTLKDAEFEQQLIKQHAQIDSHIIPKKQHHEVEKSCIKQEKLCKTWEKLMDSKLDESNQQSKTSTTGEEIRCS